MSKKASNVLGLATFWPPTYMVIYVGFWLIAFLQGVPPDDFSLRPLQYLHVMTMLWTVVLGAIYCIHVMKNGQLGDRRTAWLALVLMGGPIAMPCYWYSYLRPSPRAPYRTI